MANTIYLTIAQIDKILFQGTVFSVNCPGREGEMTILPNHIPLVSPLRGGQIRVRVNEDKEESFDIEKGILEVSKTEVTILL